MKASVAHGVLCLSFVLGAAGCSTTTTRVGSIGNGEAHLVVGQKYTLQRPAILLARRGMIDSIENPDRPIETYQPYKDYDPYYIRPIAVLSAGTLIEVKELHLRRDGEFAAFGEIVSGPYKRQVSNASGLLKRMTLGGRPKTGEVRMNRLCGGRAFAPEEFARNLAPQAE